MSASVAYAEPQQSETSEIAEIVIVTGSYIKGTAEDAALPVDVMTTDDLAKQGSPNMVDIIKSIPAVQGVIGESNQFGVAQGAGTGNVNLRGLGGVRTLVLLNGRRLPTSPVTGQGVDTNLLPVAAIGRIEVLKDGAAATYGSDAIGGVVNFITKENFTGFDFGTSYSYIDGSDGDYDANISWGWEAGSSSGLIAANYRHRSELSTLERDWAFREFAENPQGGWSGFSNPGVLTAVGVGGTTPILDPACTALGGVISAGCRFNYIAFDNLVEDEDHYNVYADYNLDISDSLTFKAEALWAVHDVDGEHVSPSYGPNQGPNGGAPSYFVPLANPGLQALLPSLSAAQQAAIAASSVGGNPGVIISGLQWRPFAQGGNPAYGNEAAENSRKFDRMRGSMSLEGQIGSSASWTTALTYSEETGEIVTPDILVSRLQLALRGLGGPNCTGLTPGANGCLWLNPTSTGVARNGATGETNTLTYTPGTENSAELARWLMTPNSYEATTTVVTFDTVFSGEMGWSLPGGAVGWALGAQYRDNTFERVITDDYANIALNPCASSPINPAATCTSQTGALSFYGPMREQDLSQDMYAVFGEMSLPIFDSLQAQLALRYEDYGGRTGSTTNPKLSVRWQPVDWFAMRASAGTTFRAPGLTSLEPGFGTTLFFMYGGYKPVDTYGNPDLKPETADTLNFGLIFKAGGFNATVDYFQFTFEDALTTEVGTQLAQAFFGPNGTAAEDHCGEAAYAELQARFTFAGACSATNLIRTRSNQINAQSEIEISGIDASMQYVFDTSFNLAIGVDGTYNFEYKVGANYVGGILIDPAQDAIGTRGGRGGTLPEWKSAAYIDVGNDMHNVRWTSRYVDGVTDVRTSILPGTPGKEIDGFLTHDLVYRLQLPAETTITASVFNVLDEDPSFARLDLSYDPFIGNPLGRYWKLGFNKRF